MMCDTAYVDEHLREAGRDTAYVEAYLRDAGAHPITRA